MFLATLVLLFILKIRFPRNLPITRTIQNKYGVPAVQIFRRCENIWKRRDKISCDIKYLEACLGYEVIPKFLRIRLYRKVLENSSMCKSWQMKLLRDEIKFKNRQLQQRTSELNTALDTMKTFMSAIDFSCIRLWLTRKQQQCIKQVNNRHQKKLYQLGISPIASDLKADKVIFNYSDRILTPDENRLLLLGLDFGLPVYKLNFHKYYLAFEKIFSDCRNFPIYNRVENAREVFKTQLKSIAHKYFHGFKHFRNGCPLFKKSDVFTLKKLASDPNIYVTRPDKGCGVVLLNRTDYIDKVNSVLNDVTKFDRINIDEKKIVIKLEDRLNNVLRSYKSKKCITSTFYDKCYSSGSQLGVLYGLPKIHKENCPIRPIVSACSTHNFNIGKELIPLISHLATNEYTLKNSYDFVSCINNFSGADNYFMCSLDVESLYTNIPVNETIEIILDAIFTNDVVLHHDLSRDQLKKLLNLALCDSYFKFNNAIYKQKDGLAMGSSLSPIIANIFLNHFEEMHLNGCPNNIKPQLYRRYLDDTFLLFRNSDQASQFFEYFNDKHPQIKFTYEPEQHSSLSFLDVTVSRHNNYFTTSVFRKKTFTGLGLNYFSNLYHKYKLSNIYTLIYRAYRISSSYDLFHSEISYLQTYFKANYFPLKIFNATVKRFLNNRYSIPVQRITVPKQNVYMNLPLLGYQNNKMKLEVQSLIEKYFPQVSPSFYFRNLHKIGSFFRIKDSPDMLMRSSVIYEYKCDCCQQSYIGSTTLQMFRRIAQHKGVSFRTGQQLSKPDNSSIRDHCFNKDHPLKTKNFSIIGNCTSCDLRTLESIFIQKLKPTLNSNQSAVILNVLA